MDRTKKSFIREILKVTQNPDVISFAGGLPNPKFFPVQEISTATQKMLHADGQAALQYSTTEGYPPLRQFIAKRYKKFGVDVSAEQILITNGSQQGLDLIGKLFIDPDDPVVIERPGYLGAIQALSLYEPHFHPVPLHVDGIDTELLAQTLDSEPVKLIYSVPNFQNPSGITYSARKRADVAALVQDRDLIFVEDNPYGELRFAGEHQPSFGQFLADNLVLLGSFSKIVAPALRLGWICAPPWLMDRLVVAKQASDLHSNYLAQRILHQFLLSNNLDLHLQTIRAAYKQQRDLMVAMLEELMPPDVSFTRPEGGMFVWVTLPQGVSSLALFDEAARRNVAFVPGHPFYVDGGGSDTLRLNFSNAADTAIEVGIQRLADALKTMMTSKP
jgi:2-aminoadipate transaminase